MSIDVPIKGVLCIDFIFNKSIFYIIMKIQEILDRLNVKSLNKMQYQAGDVMVNTDNDLVVLSATGSGKTLAYLLPLAGMLNPKLDKLQAVVIVPGRELALQSYEVFVHMGCGIRSMALYGGRTTMEEHRNIQKTNPQIVFATPGRFNDHFGKGNIVTDNVRYLVIDEFDKCLKMGFHDEMRAVINSLSFVEKRVLLSATDTDEIPNFVNMGKVTRLDFLTDTQIPDRINIFMTRSKEKDKLNALYFLLCSFGESSSIVFLNYRDSVNRVANYLSDKGFIVSSFHGGLDQKARENAIYKFSNGSANVLVGTDLASRGLDIPDVDNIVHYHLPIGEEEYIHRVGRTGRWQAKGRAFFLLAPDEQLPEYVKFTPEIYLLPSSVKTPPQPRMVTLYIGKGKKDKISKGDVLGFLCKVGGLNGCDIGRIDVKERCSYAAVNRDKWKFVVERSVGEKLKGIKTVVELIK